MRLDEFHTVSYQCVILSITTPPIGVKWLANQQASGVIMGRLEFGVDIHSSIEFEMSCKYLSLWRILLRRSGHQSN